VTWPFAVMEMWSPNARLARSSQPRTGYPDMGNGRYSAKLTDEQWLKFNYAQRAHQNYVEGAASIITFVVRTADALPRCSHSCHAMPLHSPVCANTRSREQLLSGLFYPRVSAALGLVNVVGRLVYGILYRKYGPSGRLLGAGLVDLALLGLFGTALYGGFQLAGGVNGWIAFGKSFLSLLPL